MRHDAKARGARTDDAALWVRTYARRGFRVLPLWGTDESGCLCPARSRCSAAGKHPIASLVPHGVHDATLDVPRLLAWARRFSRANWGIATGHPFGRGLLIVLDVDPRNYGDETIAALERDHGPVPITARTVTGGGGWHAYLLGPNAIRSAVVGPGVELKSSGGYVVAPPSRHASGREYVWDAGAHIEDVPIASAPAWLLDRAPRPKPVRLGEARVSASRSFVGRAFKAAGLAGAELRSGALLVRCPWADQHSDDRGLGADSSCVVLPPRASTAWGCFRCLHASHGAKTTLEALASLPPHAIAVASHACPNESAAYARALAAARRRNV